MVLEAKDTGACVVIALWNGASRERPEGQRERDVACSKGKWDDDMEGDCGPPYLGGFEMYCTTQHLGSTVKGVACSSNLDISALVFLLPRALADGGWM